MNKTIKATSVSGSIQAPASKSVAQRAIAIASLAEGISQLEHVGKSDDVKAAIEVCRLMGADIQMSGEKINIRGGLSAPQTELNCGEAGLGIRMFAPVAATLNTPVVLTGEGSLAGRPMDMLEKSLQGAGVFCITQSGFLPVTVKGPLPGGIVELDGSVSSQVLTGLLIAAPYALNPMHMKVDNLKSRPYIDITLNLMRAFGVEAEHRYYEEFFVKAPQRYQSRQFVVEGDWSGAAFMLVAAAIAGELEVQNLDPESFQADKAILQALQQCGARVQILKTSVRVKKEALKAFSFDATHCPDLFPPLVALASACEGVSTIKGVSRLKVKESDRATALQQEFGKMGLQVELENDLMHISGGTLKGARVHSHHDHRIAMACAVAALNARGEPVEIEHAHAVAKSYPEFFSHWASVTGG